MTSDAETRIDWSSQIAIIRDRYEAALRAGETLDLMENWLRQVPEHVRPTLRAELEQCEVGTRSGPSQSQVITQDEFLEPAPEAEKKEHVFDYEGSSKSAVKGCETFQALESAAVEALESELQPKSFSNGELLLEQGEQARGLHLILSGTVDIIDQSTGERIASDGPGSVMGEMSLLTGQPCSARVIATSEVNALVLSNDGYRRLQKDHPEIEIALSQLVSDRLGGRKHDALCGKLIGDYRMVRCINRGGMGVVYEAATASSGDSVALKMLRHRFIYDDHMKSRFDQEAKLLGNLQHENIISLRDHFLAYRTRFLVLDLCDGADLFHVLQVNGPLSEEQVRAVLGQIARGLLYAHQAGVIHRDLKPGNVLVDRQGVVKLTDFGLSRLLASEVLDGKAVGTPSYMPPEQFRSADSGPECDWYALGCLACEMLTGKILFQGRNWMEIFDKKRRKIPSAMWPEIKASAELTHIIHDSLQPESGDRRMDLEAISQWARPTVDLFA